MHAASESRHPTPGFLLLVGAMTAFGAVSIDLYLPALALLAGEFGVPEPRMQQTMSAFFIGMGLGQLVWGPLSDRVGRRGPLLLGCLLYTLASLAAAFAPSLEALIAARFAQALGASSGVVIARAVVRDRFDTVESARIFSLLFLVLGVAPLFAPLLGAALLELAGWQSIFLVLALFGLLLGLAARALLPETRSAETASRARGETPARSYLAAVADRRVLGFVLAGAANGTAFFAYIAGSPLLFMGYFGLGSLAFSLAFALNAAGLIGMAQLNRALVRRFSPGKLLLVGATGAALSAAVLLLVVRTGDPGLPLAFGLIFLAISSYGLVSANSMALALARMPERAGTVSALIGAVSLGAGALSTLWASTGPGDVLDVIALQMAAGFTAQLLILLFIARPLGPGVARPQ